MSHKCAKCALEFGQYFLYKMHIELDHVAKAIVLKPIQSVKRARLSVDEKRTVSIKMERRLGIQHFYGVCA